MDQLIQQLQHYLAWLLSLPSWIQALMQSTIQQVQAQLASLLAGGASGGGGAPPGPPVSATPEIESVVLFGVGALGLAAAVWWQRRRHGRA
jgi:hypothetical protein